MTITTFPKTKRHDESFDQACMWLSKIDRDLTQGERTELEAWLAGHPDNPALLMQIAQEWDKFDALTELINIIPEGSMKKPSRKFGLKMGLAIAASLLMAAVAIRLIDMPGKRQNLNPTAERYSYATEVGEKSNVMLSDGSELTLNTNTRLTARFSESERAVILERGEFFVHVKKDRRRPFSVYVGDRVVQAIGTAFNVEYVEKDVIEVIVTEGAVVVRPNATQQEEVLSGKSPESEQKQTLIPVKRGEIFQATADTQMPHELIPEEISTRLAWRSGNLVFNGETLSQAILEIERYTDVKFVIADSHLSDTLVAGVFRAGDVDGLLKTLEDNFDISHQHLNSDQVLLVPR